MSGREKEHKSIEKGKAPGVPGPEQSLRGVSADKMIFDECPTQFDENPSDESDARTPRTSQIAVTSQSSEQHLDDLRRAIDSARRYGLTPKMVRDFQCRAIRHKYRPEVAERIIANL